MHISLQSESSVCDWFFSFAHQGNHFTLLTGLAHSRLETLGRWAEANVSDVLLTCWANNFHHQQFYFAPLVPAVKLTMHSISIRQENDPCRPCVSGAEKVERSKLLNWKKDLSVVKCNILWLMNTMHQLCEKGGCSRCTLLICLSCQIFVWKFGFTTTLCFTCLRWHQPF